jgi:RNA polymerase sigma-70 factor (ECF subfamily)
MAESINHETLVRQFNQGEESAFETIVRQYSADVAQLANRLLGWPGDVEDVTQDTFLSAFMGLKRFRCECSLKTWLFTITINKCRAYRYKRMLRLRSLSQAAKRAAASSHCSADSASMDNETFDQVRETVRALPAKYREVIVLKYLEALPSEQVAQILGISTNALHVRLNRARKHLKDNLAHLMESNS